MALTSSCRSTLKRTTGHHDSREWDQYGSLDEIIYSAQPWQRRSRTNTTRILRIGSEGPSRWGVASRLPYLLHKAFKNRSPEQTLNHWIMSSAESHSWQGSFHKLHIYTALNIHWGESSTLLPSWMPRFSTRMIFSWLALLKSLMDGCDMLWYSETIGAVLSFLL